MGLLSFISNAGRDLFGGNKGNEAQQIKAEVEKELGDNITNLGVLFNEGKVTLQGEAKSLAAKEKATLIAGNVKGVESVSDDRLNVAGAPAPASTTRYYKIQSGDSLSKIAKEFYGDANRYHEIFEANREVIKDPDLIYPGQQIRIP